MLSYALWVVGYFQYLWMLENHNNYDTLVMMPDQKGDLCKYLDWFLVNSHNNKI